MFYRFPTTADFRALVVYARLRTGRDIQTRWISLPPTHYISPVPRIWKGADSMAAKRVQHELPLYWLSTWSATQYRRRDIFILVFIRVAIAMMGMRLMSI